MRITPLPAGGFRSVPWKNGGGTNIDIASRGAAEDGSRFEWRLGRTRIERPGPFSDFSGYERLQVVVEGRGLMLETPAGDIYLSEAFRPVRYDGATPIVSRLEAGPVGVVNLIARRDRYRIDLAAPAGGAEQVHPPGLHILYASSGALGARVDGQVVAVPGGDACEIRAEAACRIAVSGHGAVLASIFGTASSA